MYDHWFSFSARKSNNCWDGGEKVFVVIQDSFVEFSLYNNTEVNNYSEESLLTVAMYFLQSKCWWLNKYGLGTVDVFGTCDLRAHAYDIDF